MGAHRREAWAHGGEAQPKLPRVRVSPNAGKQKNCEPRARGGGGAWAPTLPRATRSSESHYLGTLFTLCLVQISESHAIFAVCRVLAISLKTSPNPGKSQNLKKSAHRRVDLQFSQNWSYSVVLQRSRAHCKHLACRLKFVNLKFLGPETVGKGCAMGGNFGWRAAASGLKTLRRRAPGKNIIVDKLLRYTPQLWNR